MDATIERAGECGTLLFAGTGVDILVPAARTGGAFSLLRVSNPPGCWTPPHLHRHEDETVFVLSGTVQAETEQGTARIGPGEVLVLPRGRPHRLGNAGPGDAHFMVLCTPGGFDGFVRDAGRAMPQDGPVLAEADVARLVQAAPRHGVELLAPDALRPAAFLGLPAASAAVDVLGVRIRLLAEFGTGEDDPCLLHGRVPAGVFVPLHGHADPELLFGLGGMLDTWIGPAGEAAWRTMGAGDVADIPGGVPHALRNRGTVPADCLLVTTRRIAGLFRETGHPVGDVPPGPPSRDRVEAFVAASNARGYRLGSPAENAALGFQPG